MFSIRFAFQHIKMTNLRSRSQLRYANSTIALREKKFDDDQKTKTNVFFSSFQCDFRRYEAELKKENKTEEYRELARRQIRNIDAALPILKFEKNETKKIDEFRFVVLEKKTNIKNE